jgi:hypothetical protein
MIFLGLMLMLTMCTEDDSECVCTEETWLYQNPRGVESEDLLSTTEVECQPEIEREVLEVSFEGIVYRNIVCD